MKEYDKLQQRNGLNKTLVLEVLMTEPPWPVQWRWRLVECWRCPHTGGGSGPGHIQDTLSLQPRYLGVCSI